MAIYKPAPLAVTELLDQVMREYHPDLIKAEVKIDVLMADPDLDKKGLEILDKPRVTHQGRAAHAMIRITNAKERARGLGDAEMIIDSIYYQLKLMNDRQRSALIDHELCHIEPVWPSELDYKRPEGYHEKDKYNRPKLRSIKHDIEIGWFNVTVGRWGEDSVEAMQADKLMKSNTISNIQIALDFGADTPLQRMELPQPERNA